MKYNINLFNYLQNIFVSTQFSNSLPNQHFARLCTNIEDDCYFINIQFVYDNQTYHIRTGFWNETGHDTRVEILEDGEFKNFIEFNHGQNLESTLIQAKNLIYKHHETN